MLHGGAKMEILLLSGKTNYTKITVCHQQTHVSM